VLTSIIGDLPSPDADQDREIIEREDGSWLIDGSAPIERVKAVLEIDDTLPGEDANAFNTLGGFVMHVLGRIPTVADHFQATGFRIEVIDMDKNRVDKVLVARVAASAADAGQRDA
jgi:putative hemolysin